MQRIPYRTAGRVGSCLLAGAGALLLGGCPAGGCPWTSTSRATVSPSADCLEVKISSGSQNGEQPPTLQGGCVNPVVYGVNRCDAALSFEPHAGLNAQAVVAQPGEQFEIEIDLEQATSRTEGTFFFELPATLGASELSIRFKTYSD